MKTLIIGANGKIGRILIERCIKKNINVRAMVRNSKQLSYFDDLGVDAVIGDLEGDLSAAFEGCDKVVFCAGSGSASSPHKTLLVDLWGSICAIEMAEKNNIKQFIMLSSLKSDIPLQGPEKIRHYLVARHCADDRLMRSDLNYTLLRPGRLLDEPESDGYSSEVKWDDTTNSVSVISRESVVSVIISLLESPLASGKVIDFIKGDELISDFMKRYQ